MHHLKSLESLVLGRVRDYSKHLGQKKKRVRCERIRINGIFLPLR
jgi:hypothetical protein